MVEARAVSWRLRSADSDTLQRDLMMKAAACQEGEGVTDALRLVQRQVPRVECNRAGQVAHLEVRMSDLRHIAHRLPPGRYCAPSCARRGASRCAVSHSDVSLKV